jgi:uncharacterized membrane-anchored protein YitT (DUF2179 family)
MSAKAARIVTVIVDLVIIILGTLLTAFALNKFTIPTGLLAGGVPGTAQIIHYFIPIKVGIIVLLLNIPILIIGYKFLGRKFSIYTIISSILLGIFLYMIPVGTIWTDNILLNAIFGGGFNAIGCCLVLRRGGSQGGMDVISRVLAKHKNISVGKGNLIFNGCIVATSGMIYGAEIALYTIISIFCSMKTYEVVLNHVDRMSLIIVTDKGQEISDAINRDIHRGTTLWNANGGYSHKEKTVLFCVIMKGEMNELKKIVKAIDPSSFVNVISTENVIGRFHQIW